MSSSDDSVFFLLTGEPGVGKTTLTKNIAKSLISFGTTVQGFYTEEVRGERGRIGFDIVSFNGDRGPLARVGSGDGPSVGKYKVKIKDFENIALQSMNTFEGSHEGSQRQSTLLVIDEIGKMELFSDKFKAKIIEIWRYADRTQGFVILATIPSKITLPFVHKIRNYPKTQIWEVTRNNRDSLQNEIIHKINKLLIGPTSNE